MQYVTYSHDWAACIWTISWEGQIMKNVNSMGAQAFSKSV